MAGDQFEVLAGPRPDLPCDIAVGSPVVAEAADAVLLVPLVGQGIDAAGERNGGVEGSFKTAHHQAIRQNAPKDPNGLNVGRIVGRSDVNIGLHGCDDLIRELMDAVITFGQNGLKADGLQLFDGIQCAGTLAQQILQKEPDPRGVIRNGDSLQLLGEAVPVVPIGEDRVLAPDALCFGLHKNLRGRHVEELVLE